MAALWIDLKCTYCGAECPGSAFLDDEPLCVACRIASRVPAAGPCSNCAESGRVDCPECDGVGHVECNLGHEHDCEECESLGEIDCPYCKPKKVKKAA